MRFIFISAFDIDALARMDYVVCTFSSNVGRLVYQLRAARRPDVLSTSFSVDQEQWFSYREVRRIQICFFV